MARLLYACRFEVSSGTGFDEIIDAYQDWIQEHYRIRRKIPGFEFRIEQTPVSQLPVGHQILTDTFVLDGARAATIDWYFPDDNDSSLRWNNSIRVGADTSLCSVDHTISVESIDYRVSPSQVMISAPQVIRTLCERSRVTVGQMRILAAPYRLNASELDEFLKLLRSPLRKLPLIFLSPYANGDKNLIDPITIASRLAGVSIVVEASDPEVTWEVSNTLGRSLSCFDGGARIYWPGFDVGDEPRFHPLYLGTKIELLGPSIVSRAIERTVFGVAAFRFVPDSRISAIIDTVQHERRIDRLERQNSSGGQNWEEYAIQLDAELESTRAELSSLKAENENLKNNQVFAFSQLSSSETDVVPDSNTVVENVTAAVERATSECQELVILPSAVESAKDSPFGRPADVWEALNELNEVAREWSQRKRSSGNGGDLRQHLTSRGLGRRCAMHISKTTKSKHGNRYKFEYKNQKQFFEPHITLGSGDANSCASIHFILDEELEKIVIGHVGRHLPNTKT